MLRYANVCQVYQIPTPPGFGECTGCGVVIHAINASGLYEPHLTYEELSSPRKCQARPRKQWKSPRLSCQYTTVASNINGGGVR